MILRALLLLLLALTATPAPAAAAECHRPAAQEHGRMHHQAPADGDEVAAEHACVGCVPPSDWLRARVAGPLAAPAVPTAARVATLAIGSGVPPALPPPRAA